MSQHDIAIAGIGWAAEIHAKAIRDIDDASLVAGSCRTREKGRAFADEYDCAWYDDTETMLDAESPDVLSVCTPSGAHLDPTLAAAERGVDVLCEKPLEVTTERIDRMVDACEAAGVALGGVFPKRFSPVVRTVFEAAAAGRFGRLTTATAHVPWWRDDDYYADSWHGTRALDGGGAGMNQSIHSVDAVQWLAGAAADLPAEVNPVAEVFAYTDTLAHDGDGIEVEDTLVATLKYRNGALGQLLGATSTYPGSSRRIRLGGRDGTAEIVDDELHVWQFREERDDEAVRREFGRTETDDGVSESLHVGHDNHRRNIEAFLDSLAGGEFVLDAAEARKAVEIVEAMYESAETGRPVTVG